MRTSKSQSSQGSNASRLRKTVRTQSANRNQNNDSQRSCQNEYGVELGPKSRTTRSKTKTTAKKRTTKRK